MISVTMINFLRFQAPIAYYDPAVSTSLYVTSVGATQIKPGSTVDDPEVAAIGNLTHGPFYSGGGFSNVLSSVRLLFI